MKQENKDCAERYARAIRNPAKRAYAFALLRAWENGEALPDEHPGIGAMAAQAAWWGIKKALFPGSYLAEVQP